MPADMKKIAAVAEVAFELVQAGLDIYKTMQTEDNLTAAQLLDLIDAQNEAQAEARAKLIRLLDAPAEGDGAS